VERGFPVPVAEDLEETCMRFLSVDIVPADHGSCNEIQLPRVMSLPNSSSQCHLLLFLVHLNAVREPTSTHRTLELSQHPLRNTIKGSVVRAS
jgi:hypothetical protein